MNICDDPVPVQTPDDIWINSFQKAGILIVGCICLILAKMVEGVMDRHYCKIVQYISEAHRSL